VRYSGERHKRISRLWRAWLEAAYPHVEIWESWTEVFLQRGIPDGLAWGQAGGKEILFWLEVDSGHSARRVMGKRYLDRMDLAIQHAKDWQIKVVFCIMGPFWVVDTFALHLHSDQWDRRIAMIGHDWRVFGKLPTYEFGCWRDDLDETRDWLEHRSSHSRGLSFDPAKYPRKSKKQEKPKKPKVKSNKPRYISPNYEDDDIPWERDPNDR
jgi:hypothetical protein